MIDVQLTHTSSLDAAKLRTIRAFLDEAFEGAFDDHDWDHALGGLHVLVMDGEELVAHGSIVQRRLLHRGRAFRTGYLEAIAVRADRRRRGLGRAVVERLNEVVRDAYELGGLSAGEEAGRLYRSLGWRRWEGRTWVLSPRGLERTPSDDDSTYVLPLTADLDLTGDLACDWRDGDVW